ncbi:hypothetical protein BL143_00026980 [Klebsiella pneumoniae]|nr:hypothetical protein CWQ24_30020 [Klebsiella pneumoniae]AVO98767.1 hypothetical protein AM475_28955 [Klebsiella pneumoniae subsp. ozaenae]MBM5557640.1 hypothetical protein [Klebsiella quasipneumoniae]OUQ90718.1 hypothetical protein B5L76_25125 [Enterobacter hormaechei subsp. xiangfangensis]OVU31960.1 hypothetical protein BME18_22260 [Klebsiella michiganensis]PTX76074.1 hypothetical protein C1N96_23840 [Enterobacter hormaechei]RNX67821.1 hypothetical protein C5Y11_024920 [Klebsiella pneumon
MYKTDRFRTLLTVPVQNLVKLVSYMRYNSYTHFVQKIMPCHEFLLTVGSPRLNRQRKISAGKLKQPVLPLNHSA